MQEYGLETLGKSWQRRGAFVACTLFFASACNGPAPDAKNRVAIELQEATTENQKPCFRIDTDSKTFPPTYSLDDEQFELFSKLLFFPRPYESWKHSELEAYHANSSKQDASVKSLTVWGCKKTGIQDWIRKYPSLEGIELEGPAITDNDIDLLASIQSLEMVVIENTSITDDSAKALVSLPKLAVVYIDSAKEVTDGFVKTISQCRDLKYLILSDVSVTGQTFVDLQQANRLLDVVCVYCPIEPRFVADLVHCRELRSVSICDVDLTDKDVMPLLKLPKVERLGLRDTLVTRRLAIECARNSAISELWVHATQVTRDDARDAEAMRGSLKVVYYDP